MDEPQIPDPANPANPNPSPDTTNTNLENLIKTTLAESERARQAAEARSRELEDRINTMNRNVPATPEPKQFTDKDFYESPVNTLTNMIAAQIAPLKKTAQEMEAANIYFSIKNQYRNLAGFNKIEGLVDQFMQGKAPTHANFQECIQRAVGQLALTNPKALFEDNVPNNPPANPDTPDPKVVPINTNRVLDSQAHLRPSTPVTKDNKDTKPTRRPLTENERRVIKESNITEDRYWELLESSPKVDSWAKKGAK